MRFSCQRLSWEERQDDASQLKEDNLIRHALRAFPSQALIEGLAGRKITDPKGDDADTLFHGIFTPMAAAPAPSGFCFSRAIRRGMFR